MKIVLLCATHRGLVFLEKLANLISDAELIVFSFREEQWEPPFLDKIHELTKSVGGEFYEGKNVGSPQFNQFWETNEIEIMFLVSWRYLLPPKIFNRPHLGTFVFHDSLLPKYRGFSPTVWAIINGETQTGVTLFEIADEVDSGDIIDQQSVPINPDETISEVMKEVTNTYLKLLERNLKNLLRGKAHRIPQEHSLATYTCKRLPEDNLINWECSTENIYNLIRAVTYPYPGAYTYLNDRKLIIWSAKKADMKFEGTIPGRVARVHPGIGTIVLTGDGALLLEDIQQEGKAITCSADLITSINTTLGK